jgi:ribosomal peptide maturation radical SAM protein 1
MAPNFPSIQLATLAAALRQERIESESLEFYLDYAARIGVRLYEKLSNAGGFIEEWIFARHYYGAETGDARNELLRHWLPLNLGRDLEDLVLEALDPVTDDFLEELARETDWLRYDVVGFSLTISQLASSMALSRLIKRQHPEVVVVFGGSGCAGPMGAAVQRICPYVDVAVSVEGERVLPEIVRRVRSGRDLAGLPGTSWRAEDGSQIVGEQGHLYPLDKPLRLRFDEYFDRLKQLGLRNRVSVWLPFESSRGCWYGEKMQCAFCGLHEIMKFRRGSWEHVLEQLEDWEERYGVRQFFAVDLIMPREHFETFLPEIARRGHEWSIFYEVKANLNKAQVRTLAEGGVRWLQPGIESLDDEVLRLMKKGVSALRNIQLLKWCEEFDIRVTWNLLLGTPGETAASYERMAERIWWLFHLMPPSGAAPLQLHRFSPHFKDPEAYGIAPRGAHPLYQQIFPVSKDDLDAMTYLHDYVVEGTDPELKYTESVREALRAWKAARKRGASLTLYPLENGAVEIIDTRTTSPALYRLTPAEASLYAFLDESKVLETLASRFRNVDAEAADTLESGGEIGELIEYWNRLHLVLLDQKRVLALAVRRTTAANACRSVALSAPHVYLVESPL